jgi:lipopolysaccharide export system permease protein
MKKIIFKKLSNEILIFFLIFSLALTLIVWVIQAVNYLDIVTEDGHSFGVYFNYTALSLPKIFSQLLPFAFFLSVFYIVNLYEEKNQLLVYWTHGVTKKEFIDIIIKFSLSFLIMQLLLTTIIAPYTNDKSRSFIRASTLDFFPNLIKPKKFIDTVENLTIFIDSKNSEGDYVNIILKDSTNNNNVQTIIAQTGKIVTINNQKVLLLNNGKIIQANSKKEITTFNFKETQFDLSKYSTKTTTYPKIKELETVKLIRCLDNLLSGSKKELLFKDLQCKKNFIGSLIQELFKRLYFPFYILLMALTSSLLVLKSKNTPNYSTFKTIVFLIGVLFLIVPEILVSFTGDNYLNNLLFLSFPIFSFIIIYQYVNLRVKFN